MNPLENMNVRRLVAHIKGDLKKGLDQFAFETNDEHMREQVKKTVESYLETVSAVKNYEVGPVKTVYHGWKELYPTLGRRIMAWLGVKVFRFGHYTTQRWFHTVFPFVINYNPMFRSEALQQDDGGWIVHMEFDGYADANHAVAVDYSAAIRTPYETMDVDFKITPVTPVEFIRVNLALQAGGA